MARSRLLQRESFGCQSNFVLLFFESEKKHYKKTEVKFYEVSELKNSLLERGPLRGLSFN